MFKNEDGYTFLEGLISLGLVLLLAITLFPMFYHMLNNLNEGKEEVLALRLLYEHVEKQAIIGTAAIESQTVRQIDYKFILTEEGEGNWVACVYYDKLEKCIKK